MNLYGMELIATEYAVDRVTLRARTHSKKRIDKKWLKRYGWKTFTVPSQKTFVMGNKIIGHPIMIEKIKRTLEKEANEGC